MNSNSLFSVSIAFFCFMHIFCRVISVLNLNVSIVRSKMIHRLALLSFLFILCSLSRTSAELYPFDVEHKGSDLLPVAGSYNHSEDYSVEALQKDVTWMNIFRNLRQYCIHYSRTEAQLVYLYMRILRNMVWGFPDEMYVGLLGQARQACANACEREDLVPMECARCRFDVEQVYHFQCPSLY